jgi:hypothetical protein
MISHISFEVPFMELLMIPIRAYTTNITQIIEKIRPNVPPITVLIKSMIVGLVVYIDNN